MSKPISIQLYTVRELMKTPDDTRRVIEAIAEIGYVAVEGGVPKGFKAEEFKGLLDGVGLRLGSAWAQPTEDNVTGLVEQAQLFGFDCYVGCYGPDQCKSLDATRTTAAAFEAMAKLLRPHGLTMCYHNHWWEFVPLEDGRYPWDVIMSEAPTLSAELDIYWASNFGQVDVPALVERYAGRTPLLHAKDGPLVRDEPNTAVGAGRMDNALPIRRADAAKLQYVVVELDRSARDVMQDVRDSYAYLTGSGLARGRK